MFVTLATDSGGAKNTPPTPLDGSSGNPLLGVLGPLDEQAGLLDEKSRYRRFTALRVEKVDERPSR